MGSSAHLHRRDVASKVHVLPLAVIDKGEPLATAVPAHAGAPPGQWVKQPMQGPTPEPGPMVFAPCDFICCVCLQCQAPFAAGYPRHQAPHQAAMAMGPHHSVNFQADGEAMSERRYIISGEGLLRYRNMGTILRELNAKD